MNGYQTDLRAWICLTVVVVIAAMAPGAFGLDGDPPITPVSPTDGATVPTNSGGIPVTFTCPVYRKVDLGGGFILFGGAADYAAILSTSPTLGADGRLATKEAIVNGALAPGASDTCAVALGAGGAVRPQEVPGTYYWQVSRLCSGCTLGYESGPVLRLVLQSQGVATLTVPAKTFAGFPFIARVGGSNLPTSATLEIQRLVAGKWRTLARDSFARQPAEVTVTLPGGPQKLRALVRAGAQEIVSATATRNVAINAPLRTVATGSYRGTVGSGTQSATFRVTGRRIRTFRAFVPMLCPGITAGQFTTQIGTALISSIRIAPDGTFVGVTSVNGSSIRVRGRLAGAKLTGGRVELSVGNCTGNTTYSARHTAG
jgi:hypothetical protein